MGQLAISLLGPFTITLHERPVTRFGTDKTRALLAYLIMEADRAHRRARLAGLLWPDFSEVDARHSLSQALLMLRKALNDQAASPPFLLITRQTLRFNPDSDVTLDVAAFQAGLAVCQRSAPEPLNPNAAQQVTQAAAHYQGEFLSTPLQVNSQAFEEWQLFTQIHLHMLALEALNTLGQYHAARGEFAQVATYARRQIELEPLHEVAHRQLMLALAYDNRRPEALAHYARCRALLARELGIELAPETTALYQRIHAGDVDEERLWALAQPRLREKPGTAPLAAHPDLLLLNGSGNAYTGSGDPYWPFLEMLRQLSAEVPGAPFLVQPQAARLATCRPATRAALTSGAPGLLHWLAAAATLSASPVPSPPT